jgi:tetratricopeptide (TPR) repeat protein
MATSQSWGLARMHRQGFVSMSTVGLEQASTLYRGEILEGLELPGFLDFSAWCIEQRQPARRRQCELLSELAGRLQDTPDRALPFARQRVKADIFNLLAHQNQLRLLLGLGNMVEAQQRFEHAQRLFRQVSAPDAIALDQAWRALRAQAPSASAAIAVASPSRTVSGEAAPVLGGACSPQFVGRQPLLRRVEALLEKARQSRETQLALVTGEPGLGKSRLSERRSAAAGTAGFAAGRAFEAASTRPFGPLPSLARLHGGRGADAEERVQAVDAVRRADAKYELSYLLTRWAEHALAQGRLDAAHALATEALEVAQASERSSEITNSLVVLAASWWLVGRDGFRSAIAFWHSPRCSRRKTFPPAVESA